MSPQRRDPAIRTQLLDAAARILAAEGVTAVTTRRLARETGRSTMAIYTHLGGMELVQRAVREDGFARLARATAEVPLTDDAVADLAASTAIYFGFGLTQPELYRAMFIDRPLDDDDAGQGAFEHIVAGLERCRTAGRIPAANRKLLTVWAAQLWSMRHGMVTMVLSGALPEPAARFVLSDMTVRLLIGYGDRPVAARRSVRRAFGRSQETA